MPSGNHHSGRPWRTAFHPDGVSCGFWLMNMTGNATTPCVSGRALPQERRSAAWFDGQNCSLEASIGSLIYERNTVQNGSFHEPRRADSTSRYKRGLAEFQTMAKVTDQLVTKPLRVSSRNQNPGDRVMALGNVGNHSS